MVNEHYFKINSTEDIRKALDEAEREGHDLTFYNSIFLILGERGRPISVDDSAQVDVSMDAAVYVASDDVCVTAGGDSRIYLPAEGIAGADPYLHLEGSSKVIRGVAGPARAEN